MDDFDMSDDEDYYNPYQEQTDELEEQYENQDYEDKDYFSIETSEEIKLWMYSTESSVGPFLETIIFLTDLWPMVFMCNILSATSYSQYDDISTELECINKGFEDFNLIWNEKPIDKVLDFSDYGYWINKLFNQTH